MLEFIEFINPSRAIEARNKFILPNNARLCDFCLIPTITNVVELDFPEVMYPNGVRQGGGWHFYNSVWPCRVHTHKIPHDDAETLRNDTDDDFINNNTKKMDKNTMEPKMPIVDKYANTPPCISNARIQHNETEPRMPASNVPSCHKEIQKKTSTMTTTNYNAQENNTAEQRMSAVTIYRKKPNNIWTMNTKKIDNSKTFSQPDIKEYFKRNDVTDSAYITKSQTIMHTTVNEYGVRSPKDRTTTNNSWSHGGSYVDHDEPAQLITVQTAALTAGSSTNTNDSCIARHTLQCHSESLVAPVDPRVVPSEDPPRHNTQCTPTLDEPTIRTKADLYQPFGYDCDKLAADGCGSVSNLNLVAKFSGTYKYLNLLYRFDFHRMPSAMHKSRFNIVISKVNIYFR